MAWPAPEACRRRRGVAASSPAGCLLYGGWPYLRLPGGRFPAGRVGALRQSAAARSSRFSRSRCSGDSRWRSGSRPMLLALCDLKQTGSELARRDIRADELDAPELDATGRRAERATLDFCVPARSCRSKPVRTRRSTSGSIIAAMPSLDDRFGRFDPVRRSDRAGRADRGCRVR